jgi:hypothetical protein
MVGHGIDGKWILLRACTKVCDGANGSQRLKTFNVPATSALPRRARTQAFINDCVFNSAGFHLSPGQPVGAQPPQLGDRSVFMDIETLERWRDTLAIPGSGARPSTIAGLTDAEAAAFEVCRAENLRIEQERLPQSSVLNELPW